MFSKQCNIDKTDRINRTVMGIVLIIAAMVGMNKIFFMILGIILIIEGIIGWCSIPYFISKLRARTDKPK